ncbi:hypothetical protein [Erythrobacter cryptus]|uniref:hypothetical protein n=1 Tax=Erythrobacter cryptus TaxID=196588 RepID=UPI000402E8A9|nr:hypothetical protein [Erythrobacter cryptus]
MTTPFIAIARAATAEGRLAADTLLALRREGWGDGLITRAEAEALFALNAALHERSAEWCDFFVEAIGEFVLNGSPPRLQCSEDEAAWLISQVDHDGVVETMAELECLVRILERAENTPDRLKHYVLAQVERAVLSGVGPTRCGGELAATHITAAECRIVRRVVFASGGHGPAAVTRHDAEMLFRLKDATLAEENAPEWEALFLDGVTNYLKGFTLAHAQLDHARRRELEAFIADNQASVGRFMTRLAREAPQVMNHFGKVFGKKQPGGPDYGALAAAGAEVTPFEQEWLARMIGADGEVDELETRLIARLAAEV